MLKGHFNNKTGELNVKITNFEELNTLIEKAKKEAAQLLQTIEQLETFDITFNISMDSNDLEE